jgi:type IV fimbrial biogenesis protein FimT
MSHSVDKRRMTGKGMQPPFGGASPAESGFTLIEMMVTVSVMAILLAIAVPSFQGVALSSKLTSLANDFVASAQLARSEAIKRNRPARLCASSDGATCTGDWKDGWVVLRDDGVVVQAQKKLPAGFMMSGDVTTISFSATGVGVVAAATLTVCRKLPSVGSQERVVSISSTGRPSVKRTTAGSCS